MKTNIIILLALLTVTHSLYSQDYIYTQEALEPIESVVLEINDYDVLYKTFDNQEGPDYRISVDRISKIVFKNGTERYFNGYGHSVSPNHTPGTYPDLTYSWGNVYAGHRRLHAGEVLDYLGYFNYGSDYLRAKRKVTWGITLTSVGTASIMLGTFYHFAIKKSNKFFEGNEQLQTDNSISKLLVPLGIGAACIGVGIPIWVSGDRQILRMLDDYNESRRQHNREVSLYMGFTNDGGLGFSLNF